MTPVIAIVGRPNVGKSTLFNRISRSKNALVDNQPGVTRDRLYARINWLGTSLTLVDTGGFDESNNEPFVGQVRGQVIRAIEEADGVIFMVDGRQGVLPGDEDIAQILRKAKKTVYLAVNKIDGPEHDQLAVDFYRMGLDRLYTLSAAHGYGLKALLTDIVEDLPSTDEEQRNDKQVRVTVLGRPNAGKSSLINRILGFERLVVSDIPGTTRDSVDTRFHWKGMEYLLIDTAGIRRRSRVKDKIEKFSMIKAIKSIERCHIAIVLLDASRGVADQDARICGYAQERGRGIILAVNKWDLVKKDPDKKKSLDNAIERQLKFLPFAPRINISALTGERVIKIFDKTTEIFKQFSHRIGTGQVNKAVEIMVRKHPPPHPGRGKIKILYATQTGVRPPTFVVFANRPEDIHFSYKRFISNQLREQFGLNLTPVKVIYRKR